jgi:hypothetical protein
MAVHLYLSDVSGLLTGSYLHRIMFDIFDNAWLTCAGGCSSHIRGCEPAEKISVCDLSALPRLPDGTLFTSLSR